MPAGTVAGVFVIGYRGASSNTRDGPGGSARSRRHGQGMEIRLVGRRPGGCGPRVRVSRRPGDDASAWPSTRARPGLSSAGHAGAGRGCRPVVEAADVGDAIAPHGEDLPTPACLASGRRAGDFKSDQKCPGAGGHLSDHRSRTGGSRPGPPHDDLVAVAQSESLGPSGAPQRAPGSSRSLMASRSQDSRADLTRPASTAESSAALALSGMRTSLAGHGWPFQRRCAGPRAA